MKQPNMQGAKRFFRPVTYGIIAGVAACLLLLIFMSVVMELQDVPESAVTLMATLTFVFGGMIAGLISSGMSREKGLLMGLVCGICLFGILSLASLALCGGDFGIAALTKLVAVLLAGSIGGVAGVNKRKKCR